MAAVVPLVQRERRDLTETLDWMDQVVLMVLMVSQDQTDTQELRSVG